MSSSEGAQYDPGPGGGAALNRGARGLAQKIKDWTDARIAAAIAGRGGLTSLKINGATIGLRQHLDVQMTGATGEDHPELDLARVVLPAGGGGAALPHCIAMLQSASLDVHPNTFTTIPLDTEEDDPDGWHTGSNAYFVVPSDGIYDCQGRFCWATEGATTYNGGTYRRFEIVGGEGQVNLKAPTAANSQGGQTQELAVTLLLTAGTHVYLAVRHDSDGDMTYVSTGGLRPRLSVTKVG